MIYEPIARIRFLAAIAVLSAGVTLTACSSSDSSGSKGDSAAATGECQLGATIDQPTSKDGVPACAAKPGVKTHTYPCHPNPGAPAQGSWYEVQNTNGTVMYGKPGGQWIQAESAAKPEQNLIQQMGC
jgi:hypothetical protein